MRSNLYILVRLSIAFLISFPINAQKGTRVGYIDMNIILESIDEYQEAGLLLDKNISSWKKEIELKKIQLKQYQDQLNLSLIHISEPTRR